MAKPICVVLFISRRAATASQKSAILGAGELRYMLVCDGNVYATGRISIDSVRLHGKRRCGNRRCSWQEFHRAESILNQKC